MLQPAPTLHEVVVYLPFDPAEPPQNVSQALLHDLAPGVVGVGGDLLTGGVELRLYYTPELVEQIRAWLARRNLRADIAVR